MKKITIVTAVAGVLALAPLMTGCGGGAEDDANPDDDEAQQPKPDEDGEDTGGEVEEGSGDGSTEDGT